MKRIMVMGLLALLIALVGGCMLDLDDGIAGSGRIVTDNRLATGFRTIRVTGIAEVHLVQGSSFAVTVEADDNIIDRVTTVVNGDYLVVGIVPASYSRVTVRLYVTLPAIDGLELMGTGQFITDAPIHATDLTVRLAGAGSIRLAGSADAEMIEISGAGEVHNFDLIAATATVMLSGSGNLEVTATESLDATLAGVGNITYDGHPTVMHSTVTGVGTIDPR
jgi:hypothetical protein